MKDLLRHRLFGINAGRFRFDCRCIQRMKAGINASEVQNRVAVSGSVRRWVLVVIDLFGMPIISLLLFHHQCRFCNEA